MRIFRALGLFVILLSLTSFVFAHPGKTDANGGHKNGSEYHYHHGYPAHQHINGCPYDYEDKTGIHNGSPSNAKADTTNKKINFDDYDNDSDEEKSGSKTPIYLIGGAVVVGAIYALYRKSKSN